MAFAGLSIETALLRRIKLGRKPMISLLRQRQADLVERMDAEDADPNQLEQTYADFYVINIDIAME